MKTKISVPVLLACMVLLAVVSAHAAITVDNGTFAVTSTYSGFTTWATANGGTPTNFVTMQDPQYFASHGWYESTTPNPSETGNLTVAFSTQSGHVFSTASVWIESCASNEYAGNTADNIVTVTVNGTSTKIYEQSGFGTLFALNGPTPTTGTWDGGADFKTSIDISSLVAGASVFTVEYSVIAGYSGYRYNGGAFYLKMNEASDTFNILSGTTVVPEPAALGLLAIGIVAGLMRRRAR